MVTFTGAPVVKRFVPVVKLKVIPVGGRLMGAGTIAGWLLVKVTMPPPTGGGPVSLTLRLMLLPESTGLGLSRSCHTYGALISSGAVASPALAATLSVTFVFVATGVVWIRNQPGAAG